MKVIPRKTAKPTRIKRLAKAENFGSFSMIIGFTFSQGRTDLGFNKILTRDFTKRSPF